MRRLIITLITIFLAGCHSPDTLADRVLTKATELPKDVFVLETDQVVVIRQAGEDPRTMIVSNMDGVLTALQLESGGSTPRMLELKSEREAEITISNYVDEPTWFISDLNGDGIPDRKIENGKLYVLDEIIWREFKRKKSAEQDVASDR